MAFPLPISSRYNLVSPQVCSRFSGLRISGMSTSFVFLKPSSSVNNQIKTQLHSRIDGGGDYESSDGCRCPAENEDSRRNDRSQHSRSLTSKEYISLMQRLKRYGISGILSYGLLNTIYYLTTFLLFWFYVTPAPGRMGYAAAVKRFIKVMVMVWTGSQVTKLFRAGGAVALAPTVDKGLSWFMVKFKLESQGKAFMVIASLCFGLAFMLFLLVTLLWA